MYIYIYIHVIIPKNLMACQWPSEHVILPLFLRKKNPPPPEQSSMTKHKYLVMTEIHWSSVVVSKKNVSGLSLFLCFHFFSHSFQNKWTGQSISKMAKCKRLEAQIFCEQISRSWFKLGIQHEHQNTNKNVMRTFPKLKINNILKALHHLDSKSQTWIAGDMHFGRIPVSFSQEFSGKFG